MALRRTHLRRQLGVLLQRRRRFLHLTQSQVADRARVSLKYLGQIERGDANVTIDALGRIAEVLAWDAWSLFSDRPPPIMPGVHALVVSQVHDGVTRLQALLEWLNALSPEVSAAARQRALASETRCGRESSRRWRAERTSIDRRSDAPPGVIVR